MGLKEVIVNKVVAEVRTVAYTKNEGLAKLGTSTMPPEMVANHWIHQTARPQRSDFR